MDVFGDASGKPLVTLMIVFQGALQVVTLVPLFLVD